MQKAIRNAVLRLEMLPWEKLEPFQGRLKDLSEENYIKLRGEILELGFSEAFSVWFNEGHYYILNGHQRLRAISEMVRHEEYSCPLLPAVIVEADSYQQAKRKVLALASQYGSTNKEGLLEISIEAGLSLDDLSKRFEFPEVNFDDLRAEMTDHNRTVAEQTTNPDAGARDGEVFDRTKDQYENSTVKQIVLYFNTERYNDVVRKLERLMEKTGQEGFAEVVGGLVDAAIDSIESADQQDGTP